jgi:hypothetical protein
MSSKTSKTRFSAGDIFGSVFSSGLLDFLVSNPILLVIAIIVGIVVLIVGIGLILYYGLFTGLVFLIGSSAVLALFDKAHVLHLKDYPYLVGVPFLLFVVGYGTEHFSIFDLTSDVNTSVPSPGIAVLFQILVATIIILAIAMVIKKSRKK